VSPFGARRLASLGIALIAAGLLAACGDSDPGGTVPLGDPAGSARASNTAAVSVDGVIAAGQMYIPRIAVNAPIHARGTVTEPNPFAGGKEMTSFGVPSDRSTLAWWSDGPQIGSQGLAIVLGHAQTGKGYAVFDRIQELKAKDVITVENPQSTERAVFQVLAVVEHISKRDPEALRNTLLNPPADAHLALVTCGGQADYSAMATDENVVVFAQRAL
jgi:sortase (surface protein transpeptidase)